MARQVKIIDHKLTTPAELVAAVGTAGQVQVILYEDGATRPADVQWVDTQAEADTIETAWLAG